ncbi:hypothetical protein MML48_7g00007138 [Holotrichia oblita]|uniref:Uncharacterized protein n=1 Tax=Holotrichia oblita TaxID=644536 RepID=A0ACB9STU6_HOLOL|nr:hypothetical protein MML48_7g00007138 [Holotrichia oblita]
MSRKSRMTKSQKEIIVNFLEHNDSMIKNIKHTPAELNVLNKKWEELVTLLNSTGGAKKTAKEWKEAINEFKTNVRRKARAITYDHQGTGGGPAKAKPLNNLEERMLSLLSKIVILGAPDIPEAGIATAGSSSAPINVVVDAPLNVVVDAPLNVVADTTLEDYIILNQEPELQTERIEIVLICGENTSHRVAANIFNERHPGKNVQQSTVSRIMVKFKSTGSVESSFKKPHNPIKHSEEVQLNVCLDIVEHGQTSIRHVSRRIDVQRESMPRKRILKTDRVNIDESLIKQAIVSVFNGTLSERAAARTHGIKRSTLQSRIKKVLTKYSKHDFLKKTLQRDVDSGNESEGEDSPKYSNKYTTARQVFTTDEELQLENYIKKCSDMNYGLSYVDIEKLAFQFARALPHCKIPPEWQEAQKAKLGWRQGFMKRHPTLSLRKPESTSLSRSIAFNKHKINQFFDNYLHVLQRYKFTSDKIYNLDETGVTTVMKPVRIVATCGKKQVSQVASAERGELVTFVGIISAAGDNIPPIYIFPRLRNLGDLYMHNAPDNSLALGNKSGWMTAELFPEALKHVKKHTKCHPNDPILLLCDNHESHVSLASILFCRENGIVLLTFPPHTTHRLQPLDVGVFGPFKVYCNTTFNDWLISNPGKTISVKNIAYLTNLPFEKAFTRTNIKNSFKKPGIWPLNRLVFSDEDFASNYVTDMTEESISKSQGNRGNHQQNAEETEQQDELDKILNIEHEDPNKVLATNTEMVKEKEITDESNSPCTSKAARNILKDKKITPAIVRPFPKIAERRKKGKREPGKSRIMTDTPERDRLEEKKMRKILKKPRMLEEN